GARLVRIVQIGVVPIKGQGGQGLQIFYIDYGRTARLVRIGEGTVGIRHQGGKRLQVPHRGGQVYLDRGTGLIRIVQIGVVPIKGQGGQGLQIFYIDYGRAARFVRIGEGTVGVRYQGGERLQVPYRRGQVYLDRGTGLV